MTRIGRGIQSIEVGGRILTALVDACAPMMLRDLAQASDLAPAQCHAYLTTYRQIGLVEQDPQTGYYRLGAFAMHLGIGFLQSDPVLAAASRTIQSISEQTGLMVLMLVWGPHGPTIVQIQEGAKALPLNIRQGTLFSVTGTASGHVFAAFGKQDDLAKSIEQELHGGPAPVAIGSTTQPDAFHSAVRATRDRGYATVVSVPLPGINAVSAPVFDKESNLALVVTLIGPTEDLAVDPSSTVLRQFLAAVRAISHTIDQARIPASVARSDLKHSAIAKQYAGQWQLPTAETQIATEIGKSESKGVQSISVGARLLTALVTKHEPLMLKELAKLADLAPAQAHPYLSSYRKTGLVRQEDETGRYHLGPFALALGITRMRTTDPFRLVTETVVELSRSTRLNVALVVWGTFGPTVVMIQESGNQLNMKTRPGTVYSLTGTASGRIFASYMPKQIVKDTIRSEKRENGHSGRVGMPRAISRAEMEEIRRCGYATIEPPPIPGINAISAPVFDYSGQVQFVVTLIGGEATLKMTADSEFIPILLEVTNNLSSQLGYTRPTDAPSTAPQRIPALAT